MEKETREKLEGIYGRSQGLQPKSCMNCVHNAKDAAGPSFSYCHWAQTYSSIARRSCCNDFQGWSLKPQKSLTLLGSENFSLVAVAAWVSLVIVFVTAVFNLNR